MKIGTIGSFGISGIGDNSIKLNNIVASSDSSTKRLKELEELAFEVLSNVIDEIKINPQNSSLEEKKVVQDQILDAVISITELSKVHISITDRQKIVTQVMDEIFGYGPITKLLKDTTISEVMVNSPNDIFVERKGKIYKTNECFRDDSHIMHTIDKVIAPLGRRVDESSPMVDARLPDGSRVNIIIPPLAVKGPTITIRKFAADPYNLDDLINFGTLNHDIALFIRACVKGRINILVSGGTGSGKTTLLNVISSFIPEDERIITIEDAAELQLQQEHVVTLESRPSNFEGKGKVTIRDLVINSLRMRPDRIIVGEVRGGECLDMLQAMNTGHDGSITTVHANNPYDSLSRIETMVMMSGMELTSRAIREQISSAINLIIQISRFTDGTRKIVKISEITGMESDTISLQDIFTFKQEGFNEGGEIIGRHCSTSIVPSFMEKLASSGERIPVSIFNKNNLYKK